MADDLDVMLAREMRDPTFRAAYNDAQSRSALVTKLVGARKAAGFSADELADRMCADTRLSRRRMRRQVRDYEGGLVMHNASLWFVMRYAREVGVRVRITVEQPGVMAGSAVDARLAAMQQMDREVSRDGQRD